MSNPIRQSSQRERQQAKLLLRRVAMLALLLLFASLLGALLLPWAAEGAIARSFRQGLSAKAVYADVKASPVWRLFGDKTTAMELKMEFDNSSLLALNRLQARWGPSNVALKLMREGQGGARDAEPTETELSWDEGRLATYLNRVQGEVLVSRVEISSQEVGIFGSVDVAGSKRNISLRGLPHTNDLGQVVFTASSWQAEGLAATEQLRDRLVEALSFEPDLAPLAWKVWAKQVVLEDGLMTVYGSSSCCR